MTPHLSIDFETRSAVDLRKTGVEPYADDDSTDIWCAAYAIGDDEPTIWVPGDMPPPEIVAHVEAGGLVTAWNANFEIAIWTHILAPRYGWPPCPPYEQWRCSMVAALAMSLPGSLENAAGAVGLDIGKDMSGRRLMLTMSKPRRPRKGEAKPPPGEHLWWDDEDRRSRLYAYCRQDVIVERDIRKRLVALTGAEQRLWELDQRVNKRGIRVDTALCERAKAVVAHVTQDLNRDMAAVTDYAVTATSNVNQLKVWLQHRGVEVESLDKEHLAALLATSLDADVRRALELRQEAAKASVAKINALLNAVGRDGRVRDLLQFHAASTGRWAGRRFQPQNIRRPSDDARPGEMIDTLLSSAPAMAASVLEVVYGPPLTCVSDCLRGMVTCDDGNVLYAADFSNIEGRVLAWLAGESGKVDAFRAFDAGEGPDLYLVVAARIYGRQVSAFTKKSPERQIGKVAELACGYQGGVGAFQTMAHTYGVKVPDDQAQAIVDAWRASNAEIKAFWYDLEAAAKRAIRAPGTQANVRGIAFKVVGSFLWCRLPSGRALCYCYPRLQMRWMPWGGEKEQIAYKGVNSYTRKWETIFTYGGKLAENVTQAVARDVMADAMVRLEAAGYPIVLTVHDEIVCEANGDFGSLREYEKLMAERPAWATDLPIAVEGWRAERYRK